MSLAFAIIARPASVKIKACGAQPLDRYIFERVPDAKYPQRPAGKSRAFVLCGLGIFKLQRPFAGVTKARAPKVLAWRCRGLIDPMRVRRRLSELAPV